MRPLLGLALLTFAGGAPAQNIMGPEPGVRHMSGPLHFCAAYVAFDVAADEQVGWQRGPDFDLYFLQSERGGFGLYEGNYPQQGAASEPATVSGLPARRQQEEGSGFSYLVQVPGVSRPTFVHLYGNVWKGDERDAALLARVRIGQPAAIGCERPTFQR